ncbi:MAG: hypothetical protein ACOVQA_04195 [Thermoflexibacteraceae bacterium]
MNNFSYDLTLPSPFGEGSVELFINSNYSTQKFSRKISRKLL